MVTDNDRAYAIREIRKDEVELLKDFLYEAIFIPEGVTPPPRSILDQPELRVYIDDFGSRKGDHCLVADCGGKVVGAVMWMMTRHPLRFPCIRSTVEKALAHR